MTDQGDGGGTGRETPQGAVRGYGGGDISTVISVDDVVKEVQKIAEAGPSLDEIATLAGNAPYLRIDSLKAGYGKMEILHDFNLQVAKGQSLCMIGPNGAGKSTVLHSIFGFTNIFAGNISTGGEEALDITRMSASQKLKTAGIAYILQDKSVFPDMTVEENLWMGGYLKDKPDEAKEAAEAVFEKYQRLADRRKHLVHRRKLLLHGRKLVLDIGDSTVVYLGVRRLRQGRGPTVEECCGRELER